MSQFDFAAQVNDAIFNVAQLSAPATYTPEDGSAMAVRVLFEDGVELFGDDLSPVSTWDVRIGFRVSEVQPAGQATCTVNGTSYRLVQRLEEKHGVAWWGVEHA